MQQERQSAGTTSAYAIVTCLFFAWGFITALNDPLVAAVKGIFTLSRFEAQFIAFAFFIAYFFMSFPAAVLVSRTKAMPSIVTALITMIAGCGLILLASNLAIFQLVLVRLFVLASGITILQVAANPLVAALGDPKRSHLRLTLSQTFNSLGTFIAPILGAHLFLKGVEVKEGTVITPEVRSQALAGIDTAYLWLFGIIAALTIFMWLSRKTVSDAVAAPSDSSRRDLFGLIRDAAADRWTMFGGLAIFLYVGAEVAIGTQMTAFLNDNSIWGLTDAPFAVPLLGATMGSDGVPGVSVEEAGKAVAFYWGAAMVGRAVGSALLSAFEAPKLLATFTAIAAAMCLYVVTIGGVSAGFVALAIGFFNSIMFPVIFTITLERSRASEEATSGLLCTAIVGGALVPLVVGKLSEHAGYHGALIVPALCYALLCYFAIASRKAKVHLRDEPAAASIH